MYWILTINKLILSIEKLFGLLIERLKKNTSVAFSEENPNNADLRTDKKLGIYGIQ